MTAPASPTYNLINSVASRQQAIVGPGGGMPERGRGTAEFEFKSSRVKPWKGGRIHKVGVEDLELTLGMGSSSSK
ncbi:protein BZR1-like protein 1-like [Iris pallida]|uniref:Protein BZR1-like protein 1-like n=1 Tax=Iris pallida TaxID=29817 RepID=A0AAX6H209_IRIPA|nr:protein BZR1-like protein 1-like [Iris pallida]